MVADGEVFFCIRPNGFGRIGESWHIAECCRTLWWVWWCSRPDVFITCVKRVVVSRWPLDWSVLDCGICLTNARRMRARPRISWLGHWTRVEYSGTCGWCGFLMCVCPIESTLHWSWTVSMWPVDLDYVTCTSSAIYL